MPVAVVIKAAGFLEDADELDAAGWSGGFVLGFGGWLGLPLLRHIYRSLIVERGDGNPLLNRCFSPVPLWLMTTAFGLGQPLSKIYRTQRNEDRAVENLV
jgi:hypothetical protein